MGHTIGYMAIKAKSSEEAVNKGMAFAQEFAYYNVDELEDPTRSYHGNFKFYDKVFVNEEEAQDFFNSLGLYRDGIVRVKIVSGATLNKFNEQIKKQEEKQAKIKADCTDAFMNRKSQTIGCKKCGKRFNNNEINKRQLYCPNCGNWLVSDTVKKRYKAIEEKIEGIKKLEYKTRYETGKEIYLAKVEVHC